MNDVNVGFVDRLHVAHSGVDADGDSSVDACDVHSVPRLDLVHQVVVSKEDDCVWCLASGHVLRRLLELDHLLVGEDGAVVDERHAVGGVAALAGAGLRNAASVYLHPGRVGAHLALEEGLLHLGDQLGRPDHHAADGNELVDVFWIQVPHILSLQCIEWSYLNLMF